MKKIITYIILIILCAISTIHAKENSVCVTVARHISINSDEIKDCIEHNNNSYEQIEIIIYYFSRGVETLTLSEDAEMSRTVSDGKIKCLMKFKNKKKLKKIIFLEATGNEHDDLVKKLIVSINKHINGV